MFEQTGRFATHASRDAVWRYYTSVPSWPAWSPDIQRASLEEEFVPGKWGTVKFSQVPRGRFLITAVQPMESYALTAHLFFGLLRVRFDHRLAAIPSGTQITESADFGGVLGPVLGFFLQRRVRRRWPAAMEGLCALAGAASPVPGSS